MNGYGLGLLAAFLLDQLLGDPRWLPHPVVLIGHACSRYEALTRALIGKVRLAGCLTVLLMLLTVVLCLLPLFVLNLWWPLLAQVLAGLLLYTTLAARGLHQHAMTVHRALDRADGDLSAARRAVGMIVGRQTSALDAAGIVRACVESVAENLSDGVIGPLCWSFLFALGGGMVDPCWSLLAGAAGALLYKAVNTMDSMFGYKNTRYIDFGWCPARLDDVVNVLPARLTGLLLVLVALMQGRGNSALKVLLRDRLAHSSPNAGYPEAAMAGALGIQLGGESIYFGTRVAKPTLGDARREPAPEHIIQACRLLLHSTVLLVLLLVGVSLWMG